MILLSIVVDKAISATTAEEDRTVDIGVSLPLESVKGTVSVLNSSASAVVHLPPENYTVTVVDDNTVKITVASGAAALADGDLVNIAAICRGEIARP